MPARVKYEVLGDETIGWRTRILTFPKTIWLLPGGTGTLKFFAGRAEHFTDFRLSPPRHQNQETRKTAFYDIQFGGNRPSISGTTRDLSTHGLFIVTPRKFEYGKSLHLRLGLDGGPLKLEGEVRWVRDSTLPGIGVKLSTPPTLYRQVVRDLPAFF